MLVTPLCLRKKLQTPVCFDTCSFYENTDELYVNIIMLIHIIM